MKNVLKKIKLTDKDKKTILQHLNMCTDTHGMGCSILANEKKTNLN